MLWSRILLSSFQKEWESSLICIGSLNCHFVCSLANNISRNRQPITYDLTPYNQTFLGKLYSHWGFKLKSTMMSSTSSDKYCFKLRNTSTSHKVLFRYMLHGICHSCRIVPMHPTFCSDLHHQYTSKAGIRVAGWNFVERQRTVLFLSLIVCRRKSCG